MLKKNLESLEPLEKSASLTPEDFAFDLGFDVDFLEVTVADFAEAEKFYSNLPALAHFIHLVGSHEKISAWRTR